MSRKLRFASAGEVLEGYITTSRDRNAAVKFPRELTRQHGRPETIVTDHLWFYGAAMKGFGRGDDRKMGRRINNRAETWHMPVGRRERAMSRFRRRRTLQRSRLFMPRSTTTIQRNAIYKTARPTS
jgi:putative transposase